MREIKFRGQIIGEDTWIFGDLVTNYENEPGHVYIVDEECCYIRVKPETVGQFTGLLDRKGKEIYEGDIVKHQEPNSGEYLIGEVRYGKHSASFGFYYPKYKQWAPILNYVTNTLSMVADSDFEVIGNIHESPELLK